MPVDFGDDVFVAFEAVDFAVVCEAQVEDADGLVCAAGGEEFIERGVEGESVDCVVVCVLEDDGCSVVGWRAHIDELHRQIVGHGAEEIVAESRMELDFVHSGRVVGECSSRRNKLAVEREVFL